MAGSLFGQDSSSQNDQNSSSPERVSVLVHLEAGADRGPVRGFTAVQGGEVTYEYTILPNVINLRNIPETALGGLENIPGVVEVEEDGVVEAHLDEATPLVGGLQPIPGFGGVTGEGVRICFIDSGIEYADLANPPSSSFALHPMFTVSLTDSTARIDMGAAWDFIGNDSIPEHLDNIQHGSHVAGAASGRVGVTVGDAPLHGTAPQSTIIPVKVLDGNGFATVSEVIAALQHCTSPTLPGGPADVINLSLGSLVLFDADCDGDILADAANQAVNAGAVVVASAGNNGAGSLTFPEGIASPACGSKVIGVGAIYDDVVTTDPFFFGQARWCIGPNPSACNDICTDSTAPDVHACFSNKGPLDVAAPGCFTTSAHVYPQGNGVISFCGTSQAAPMVSGLAALLLHDDPTLTPAQVRQKIRDGALDLGAAGYDTTFGYGRIRVEQSLQAGGGCTVTQNPEASCNDGIDNDCDGFTDAADPDCGACVPSTEVCNSGQDEDCDGKTDCADSDCFDCGDGAVQFCESCDGSFLANHTCSTQGFLGGTLSCDNSCAFDTSLCFDQCSPVGDVCTSDVDCCSSKCKGGKTKTCKAGDTGCTSTEVSCSDGIDNDCDGLFDGADPDCGGSCSLVGATCKFDVDCCSNKCKGKAGSKSCK